MFLIEDPDAQEEFCFGTNYQDDDANNVDMSTSTNAMGLYHPSPVGVFGNQFLPSYRGGSVGSLAESQEGRMLGTPELDSSSRLSSPSSSIFSTPPLPTNCDSSLYNPEFLGSHPQTPSSEIRPHIESPGENSSTSFLMGLDLLFQNGAQLKGHIPDLPRSDYSTLADSMIHRPTISPKSQPGSQISDFTSEPSCDDEWAKRARRVHGNRRNARAASDTPQARGVRKRVKCSICDETFSRRHDMMRHESAQHGKIQEWTCQACGKFFANESMLAIHDCRKRPR